MRRMPNSFNAAEGESILALRKTGLGIKAIGHALGSNHVKVKTYLTHAGAYDTRARHCAGTGMWAGRTQELQAENRAWKEHESWWYQAYHVRLTQMERYYANHEENKRKAADKARQRHHRLKHAPWYVLKKATRNVIARIARKVNSRRAPRTRTQEYLGCTYDHARTHLEAQFAPSMTWQNHGTYWEIDHIKPLAAFNLLNDEEKRHATHYTNLQPLLVRENRKKSDRYDPPPVNDVLQLRRD